MGINTYAALSERLTPEQIADRLNGNCGAKSVQARRMRSADHWVFEFQLGSGQHLALEAFLNGLAADDFPELDFKIQTLLIMELGPDSERFMRNFAGEWKGLVRRSVGQPWT
jgi:hypothetical protein